MHQRHQKPLRLLGALLFSVLVHVVALWFMPITWQPPKPPKEQVHIIRLIPKVRQIRPPKRPIERRPVRKPPPKKRQIRRRKPRRRIKRKRRIRKKRRINRRLKRRKRLAIAVPKPSPPRRVEPQRPAPRPPERRKEPIARRPSYRHLDLRPKFLPRMPAPRRAGPSHAKKGKKGKKGKLTPWAGNSRFARNMRAYHQRFIEDLNDRRGLVDMFFGKATVVMDRCIEVWFQRNLAKHLTKKQLIGWFSWRNGMPQRKPQWRGIFTVRIAPSGKRTVKLLKSYGVRKLDNIIHKTASRCMKRLALPKRLKGKRIYIKFSTQALAFYRLQLKNLLGLTEMRNAQTGGMEWKFTHFGSVSVSSNTLILRQTVN